MSKANKSDQLTQYWHNHVDAWKASDESGASYCKRHDLIYHRFNYWQRKFGCLDSQKTLVSSAPTGFTRIVMGQTGSPAGLTLSLPNGVVIGDICETNVTVVRKLMAFI